MKTKNETTLQFLKRMLEQGATISMWKKPITLTPTECQGISIYFPAGEHTVEIPSTL